MAGWKAAPRARDRAAPPRFDHDNTNRLLATIDQVLLAWEQQATLPDERY